MFNGGYDDQLQRSFHVGGVYGQWLTRLAVRLSVLQVEGVVADWLLAGGAQEAVHVPGLLQGIDDFLLADENGRFKEHSLNSQI